MRRACLLLIVAAEARAYCPCYTLSSPNNNNDCGVEAIPGTNPSVAKWNDVFALICQGPKVWGAAGPTVGDIGQGCGKPMPSTKVSPTFPIELIKTIAMVETGWRQFCRPDTPADQKPDPERTIISFDCGYGIGQVTSGMHKGENPAFDRMKVAGDPTYNLAAGMQILAAKWRATNCVGDNQPKVIEHWYTATWAYNGLAYSNNPNNPKHDANRPVYNPKVGGSYPYQEKVWGWMEHPPSQAHWAPLALAYPNRAGLGNTGSPPDIPDPNCAGPTSCGAKRGLHMTMCGANPPAPADMAEPPARDLAAPAPADLAMQPPADAATARPDGAPPATVDAATAIDGAGPGVTEGGCSCRIARPAAGSPLALLLFAFLLLRPRRRTIP
jgi:MYXO-CTERM domain-containing protein